MKNKYEPLFKNLILSFIFIEAISAQNLMITDVFTADPAPLVYNNTVYLYTSHDTGTVADTNGLFNMDLSGGFHRLLLRR